jgi:endonuclease YncB( thermonuclease family)
MNGNTSSKLAKQSKSPPARKSLSRPYGLTKYGRTLADVILAEGTNVNYTLIKEGWCWWYRKYVQGKVQN